MDTFVSVQFILTSYVKIMHICKSVLKYYNFIFYSIRPLAPSKTGFFRFFPFAYYNRTIIRYVTMCRGDEELSFYHDSFFPCFLVSLFPSFFRYFVLRQKSSRLPAEPNQGASQSDC